MANDKDKVESKETRYTKEAILRSSHFSGAARDMLSVLLNDSKEYSLSECESILKKEERREIK